MCGFVAANPLPNPPPEGEGTEPSPSGGGQGGGETVTHYANIKLGTGNC